ncbi:4-hydroxybenzoate polyprenyl transferase [Melanogaster broomeanus]|nr:4-hydroxybenzoate polyprenyl transferase [Melanogaster broomeanus]
MCDHLAWAATLAAYRYATAFDALVLHILALFGLCTLLHCAGCVINDILDVEYDRQVERTKSRPLPSGNLSMRSAVVLLAALLMGSLLFLALANPNPLTIVPLILYPLTKRWTNWPQAWLGLTVNRGIFVAWTSVGKTQSYTTPNVLFIGAWAWTIIYDTIYACQDRRDDMNAGVGSAALYLGPRIPSLTCAGVVNDQTAIYFVVSVGGAGLHLLWQLATVDFDSPDDCMDKFCSNTTLGFVIWLGLVLDYVVNSYYSTDPLH